MKLFLCIIGVIASVDAGTNFVYTNYEGNITYEWGVRYTLVAKNLSIPGPDYHVSGFNPTPSRDITAVEAFHIENQDVRYLPHDLWSCAYFADTFVIRKSGLEFFGSYAFSDTLHYLSLDDNNLKTVTANVFERSADMQLISMRNNMIGELGDLVFHNMPKLQVVDMSGNRLTTLNGNLFAKNTALEKVSFHSNKLTRIGSELVKPLTVLKVANFDQNICINDAFFNDPISLANLERLFTTNCSGNCDRVNEPTMRALQSQDKIDKVVRGIQRHYADKMSYCKSH